VNILHLSDLHFGPRHWDGDDELLLEKINSFPADVVIDTGDITTDGRESEYIEARKFFDRINCQEIVAVIGNHDKRNTVGHEFFKKYFYKSEIIYPSAQQKTEKQDILFDQNITKLEDNFTDVNFLSLKTINSKKVLFICIDNNVVRSDHGFVEEAILHSIEVRMRELTYDLPLLLTHYPLLGTDMDIFRNSRRLIDFVNSNKIEYVFCGHDHFLRLERICDLYINHEFNHFMCGTTASANRPRDNNVFLFYENVGESNLNVYVIRLLYEDGYLETKEEKIK
jgi:3',5'-cyclic AMP phosphodiesterase CpdA